MSTTWLACRVTGSATGSTAEAGQQLEVSATFQDAFLNPVTEAAQLQGQALSLVIAGPVSSTQALTVQQAGGLR